jgi:hypothetical protein
MSGTTQDVAAGAADAVGVEETGDAESALAGQSAWTMTGHASTGTASQSIRR